jgi:hypothetical protein
MPKSQERDGARLRPAERNRTGTLRQLMPGHYVFSSTSFNSGVIATSEGVWHTLANTCDPFRSSRHIGAFSYSLARA